MDELVKPTKSHDYFQRKRRRGSSSVQNVSGVSKSGTNFLSYLWPDFFTCMLKSKTSIYDHSNRLFFEPTERYQYTCRKLDTIQPVMLIQNRKTRKIAPEERTYVATTVSEVPMHGTFQNATYFTLEPKFTFFFVRAPLTWHEKYKRRPVTSQMLSNETYQMQWNGGVLLHSYEWIDCSHPHCASASRHNTIWANGRKITACTEAEIRDH